MEACDLLSVELRLDEIEAELDHELPPHMRTFARAYARGTPLPPAPDVLGHPETLATARAALAHPVLAERGVALLRLVAPIAIESDAGVAAALAVQPSWDALAALAGARDAAATARLGRRAIEVMHLLHGASVEDAPVDALPAPVATWSEPDGIALDDHAISHAWDAIRSQHGVDGAVRFERTERARPRTFVVQPRGEVVVVIPAKVETPAARFAVLHELGHVLAALALPPGIPRVVDEAAAAYIARTIEREGEVWYSAVAGVARARRSALARVLDRIERALPAIDPTGGSAPRPAGRAVGVPTPRDLASPIGARLAERPPWALWHDPGAQAAYVAAEPLADAITREIGPTPRPGALAAALAGQREQIDRECTGRL